ncbi:ParB N-terminal domain-containing protein [Methanosphaera sp. ISO3-F5]|uniref:ParB N-terminal domain-containing protein n=1 Tax=Methanosphaera sp. ISO3-F5 TaxID=1452353 RepID=UPI002B2632BB|nr:ParB N-terminal domain-containing protein [Methanosphaera sp. ISO3-F5]WQH64081.1 ParB N-terminal domain-containing protein [Methanosphaera sp. ISO3-F5]
MVEFEKININQIKPAPYNPRIMKPSESLKLKNNLQTFGLVDPIIIDLTDNNTVIGGHQRLEALKEIDDNMNLKLLRLGDIGLIFRETELKIKDKNDQKALNLSLNKIQGEWDWEKVDDILLELEEDNYQIELTGFDDIDLTELDITFDNIDPEETTENKTIPEKTFNEEYILEIRLTSEDELQNTYEQLTKEGYDCRILTL